LLLLLLLLLLPLPPHLSRIVLQRLPLRSFLPLVSALFAPPPLGLLPCLLPLCCRMLLGGR
jgi:hypothetical protein